MLCILEKALHAEKNVALLLLLTSVQCCYHDNMTSVLGNGSQKVTCCCNVTLLNLICAVGRVT